MGPNAFVAYNLVGFHGSGPISFKSAMAIVFVKGCAFFVVSALGSREKSGPACLRGRQRALHCFCGLASSSRC